MGGFESKLAAVLAATLVGVGPSALAHEDPPGVDANIVTALDISDSIGRFEQWLEQTGTARSVMHHTFIDAIASGHHRQVGFAVIAWSDGDEYQVVVPWTIIDGIGAARLVADAILSHDLIDRSRYGGTDDEGAEDPEMGLIEARMHRSHGGLTDVSGAISAGRSMLGLAPYKAPRNVINIFTDGVDNVGESPDRSRDLAVSAGETVNAIALGQDVNLLSYLETHVAGGPGSFVMNLTDAAHAPWIVERKFALDLLSSGGRQTSVISAPTDLHGDLARRVRALSPERPAPNAQTQSVVTASR